MVVACSFAGFIVAQAGFHVWHDLAQGLEGEVAEFVKADLAQRRHHGLPARKVELAQFLFDLVVVLVHRQHPGDAVEQFRIARLRSARHDLPFRFQALALKQLAQFLPGRELHQHGGFRIFGFSVRTLCIREFCEANSFVP